jgi:hypothetical protein
MKEINKQVNTNMQKGGIMDEGMGGYMVIVTGRYKD